MFEDAKTSVPRRWRRCLLFAVVVVSSLLLTTFYRVSSLPATLFNKLKLPWAPQYANASSIVYPPDSPRYTLFEPPDVKDNTPLNKIDLVRRLPSDCLDDHFSKGTSCNAGLDPPMDVVWTWVNGSDKLLMESMSRTVRMTQPKMPVPNRPDAALYREHDELLHSVRSVLQYFRSSVSRLRILTSDFPFTHPVKEDGIDTNKPRRLGLVPRWLKLEEAPTWWDGNVELAFTYHSQLFKNYETGIFNSLAIETQLVNMDVSDHFIYMNDDFYMLAELTASDFYTSEYGVVLRMQTDLLVGNARYPSQTSSGEWGPLEFTNWCISNRFGTRRRFYMAHTAKSLSLPLLREFTTMWQPEVATTSARPFRGAIMPHRDLYILFLYTHTIMERWREALLWAWAVGRMSGDQDEWGVKERNRAWEELAKGGEESLSGEIKVRTTKRGTAKETLVKTRLLQAGHLSSGKTHYAFMSGDGYPYGFVGKKYETIWPNFDSDGGVICTIKYDKCFGNASIATASDFFKDIAFRKPVECGDCFIHALRSASGETGLSAFLPDLDKVFTASLSASSDPPSPPHLPLISDWRLGDFSLRAVLPKEGETNVREWTLRVMERYRFIIGQTPTRFDMVMSATAAQQLVKAIDQDTVSALICINDNIQSRNGVERVDQILHDWQERRWPHRASWER